MIPLVCALMAKVLVGVATCCSMGSFRARLSRCKKTPVKRPTKRSIGPAPGPLQKCVRDTCRHRIWPGEGSTVQRRRSHIAPESLKALCFKTCENRHKKGHTRGAHEVRRGTSSIHFRRTVLRSSSHIGPRICCRKFGGFRQGFSLRIFMSTSLPCFWIPCFFSFQGPRIKESVVFWMLFCPFLRILGVRKRWQILAFLVGFLAFSPTR